MALCASTSSSNWLLNLSSTTELSASVRPLDKSNPTLSFSRRTAVSVHPKFTTGTWPPVIEFSKLQLHVFKLRRLTKLRATVDERDVDPVDALIQDQPDQAIDGIQHSFPQSSKEVEESVKVLKNAAKTRKVAGEEILKALAVIEKAKIDPSGFLDTLAGSKSPGRTWMLIFTAEKQLNSGKYFPITAIQRFDAAGKRIENGVYLGLLGSLTFEGRFSWKKRILTFVFECIRIKIGPLDPLEISLGTKGNREPSNKEDPFFVWFYIDEEIAVARGRSGGTAFWCRCRRVTT